MKSENTPTQTTDATLDFAREIVGTMWIPIRHQRIELEIRIAEALANAEARAQAAERHLEDEGKAGYEAGLRTGYEARIEDERRG